MEYSKTAFILHFTHVYLRDLYNEIKSIVNLKFHFAEEHCLDSTGELELQEPIFKVEVHVHMRREMGVQQDAHGSHCSSYQFNMSSGAVA